MNLLRLLFSFHGRINRSQYWLGSLGAGVLAFVRTRVSVGNRVSLRMVRNGRNAADGTPPR